MNRFQFLSFLLGLAIVAAQPVLSQEIDRPLTLPEAVRLALERNPVVLNAGEQLAEVRGQVRQVRADAFPQVAAEGFGLRMRDPGILNSPSFDKLPPEFRDMLNVTASNLFDAGVSVRQAIYTAGKVRTAIRLAEAGVGEKEAGIEAARQQVSFQVFKAFYDWLLAEASLQVLRETQEQRREHLELARKRMALGVATEVDVLRFQVNLANLDPELIRGENRLRLARFTLNSLIMVDVEAPTRIDGRLEYRPLPPLDVAEILGRAHQMRPELVVARRQLEEARLLLRLAEAQNKLSVDMEGRLGMAVRDPSNFFDSNFNRWSVTFNFRLPFYDSGRKAGQVAQASSRVRTAEQSLRQLENNVRLEVLAAHDDLQSLARAIDAAQLNVKRAERVGQMMQANYQFGAATTIDVLDSQTAILLARDVLLAAIHGYEVSKARLRLAEGAPILGREMEHR
ncbi:MAG: TolC family protein [Acidobacteria bacterium]|nr:TolC family protein [Acidobacteriota bacterium]